MKRIVQLMIFLLLSSATLAKVDRIIAIVNDEVITQSELDRRLDAMGMVGHKTSKKEAIDSLIDDSIKLQLAKKVNFKVTDEMLDTSIKEIAEGNHVSVQQLYGYIEQQGFSKESYREMIRKQMTIARVMQQQFGNRVHITKADIAKYRTKLMAKQTAFMTEEEFQIFNVLVPIPESAQSTDMESAKALAQKIYAELKAGKTLELLSQQYSSIQPNDLGWRKKNELPELFLTKVEKMKVSDVSQPFLAPNGFQILILNAKRVDPTAANQPVQDITLKQAEQALYQEKLGEAAKPWLERARKESYVKIMS